MPVYSVDWWNGEEWCNDQIVSNKEDSVSEVREKFLRFEEENERHVDNLTISQFKSGKRWNTFESVFWIQKCFHARLWVADEANNLQLNVHALGF